MLPKGHGKPVRLLVNTLYEVYVPRLLLKHHLYIPRLLLNTIYTFRDCCYTVFTRKIHILRCAFFEDCSFRSRIFSPVLYIELHILRCVFFEDCSFRLRFFYSSILFFCLCFFLRCVFFAECWFSFPRVEGQKLKWRLSAPGRVENANSFPSPLSALFLLVIKVCKKTTIVGGNCQQFPFTSECVNLCWWEVCKNIVPVRWFIFTSTAASSTCRVSSPLYCTTTNPRVVNRCTIASPVRPARTNWHCLYHESTNTASTANQQAYFGNDRFKVRSTIARSLGSTKR